MGLVPRTGRLMRCLGIVLWVGAGNLQAQDQRSAVEFPLRLIGLTVIPDTLQGLHVLVRPSVENRQAKDTGVVRLRFDPDTVLEWINSAAGALVASVPNGPAEGIQWSPTLRPIRGQGGIALGRSLKKGKLEKTRWLAIGDSTIGWKTEVTGAEADSLLRLLMTLGMQSRLDTARAPSRPMDDRDLGSPVTVGYLQPTRPLRARRMRTGGRVAFRVSEGRTRGAPARASVPDWRAGL